MQSLAERITASFYAWEIRGRGWMRADYPVSLEPPHRPFFLLPESSGADREPLDDGKRPTFWSRLFEGGPKPKVEPEAKSEPFEEQPPFAAGPRSSLSTLSLSLPEEFAHATELGARLLVALCSTREPMSFEVIGHAGNITLQFVCGDNDREHIIESVQSFAPEVVIADGEDQLAAAWDSGANRDVVDFGLANEFFLPLNTEDPASLDPYLALIPALAQTKANETLCLQVFFEAVRNPWAKTIADAVTDGEGGSIFADAPEFPKLAAEKVESLLVAAVVRVAACAETLERVGMLLRNLEAFFRQFARPLGNELIPLVNDNIDVETHESALLARETFRTGMILSTAELVGLVHFPQAEIRHPAFSRDSRSTKPAPDEAIGHKLVLGTNAHRGTETLVTVPPASRLEHMHVVGATGTGKSTLLLNLITQDIAHGEGLAVLDPHGDLIDDVLARIPTSRIADVALFDPSDEDYPVGFNPLRASSEVERNLIASDTVAMFRKLSTSWGDTMSTVLGAAVHTMLASSAPATLVDLRRFLIDADFRSSFLATVSDTELQYFWAKEFSLIGSRSLGPILTRLNTFLGSRLVRNIVGQRSPKLDLAEIMSARTVLLAKLPQGLIGEENAALLGSLLVTKLHQTAIARQRLPASDRTPFYCYLDEFQHFVTGSVASLLSEGRKHGIGLILAHQSMEQLKGSELVESAVLGNAHTRIVFRLGDADAKRLAEGFADFEADDLQNLARGEAIVRMGAARNDFNLHTLPRPKVDEDVAAQTRDAAINVSRERYGASKVVVEAAIAPPPIDRLVERRAALPSERAVASEPADEVSQPLIDIVLPPKAPRPYTRTKRDNIPMPPKELGKGGQEHRYLQHLIKRLGEERGFRAIIEEQLGDGRSVDVVLRRESLALAFEISVTTEIEHEIENLRKCATRAFTQVFFVSGNKRKCDQVARKLKDGGAELRVTTIAPEEIVAALDALEVPPPAESTVRGYKVKVSRQVVSYQDVAARRSAIAEVIARSLAKRANERG